MGTSDAQASDARTRSRELALGVLCYLDDVPSAERQGNLKRLLSSPPQGDEDGEMRFAELVADARVRRLGRELVELVLAHWEELDRVMARNSRKWRLERMDRVDRNALRLCTAELTHRPQIPRGVLLAEAVRLASRYGTEKSGAFVNGVAASVADEVRAASDAAASEKSAETTEESL